jgi:hypothetical protein
LLYKKLKAAANASSDSWFFHSLQDMLQSSKEQVSPLAATNNVVRFTPVVGLQQQRAQTQQFLPATQSVQQFAQQSAPQQFVEQPVQQQQFADQSAQQQFVQQPAQQQFIQQQQHVQPSQQQFVVQPSRPVQQLTGNSSDQIILNFTNYCIIQDY